MSQLDMSVTAGESGPVLVLTGEADLTTCAQLSEMLTAQLADGTATLLVDASGLSFADSVTVRALVLAARTLRERDGSLVLLHPQRPVARVLALLGADQMVTIRAAPRPRPDLSPEQRELRVSPYRACADQMRTSERGHERHPDE